MHRTLQFLCLGAALAAAFGATTREETVKAAEAEAEAKPALSPRSDTDEDSQRSPDGDLKTDASGRLFDLGLGSAYSGYGTKYQPDTGSYGTYGSYQPGYAGQGLTGYSSYGAYGGYSGLGGNGGYSSVGGLQPCYGGFGSVGSGFGNVGGGYGGFRPSYSPASPSYYPTTAGSYPGTSYSTNYPGSLSSLGPDYRGYKGFRGYSNTYSPYGGTRYGA